MKTALALLGLIIILAIGYYAFVDMPSIGTHPPDNEGNYRELQGKLDIDTVCTEALAHMSFPSGTEADAWVEACKRGEHPETIEMWKRMNNITDDRAI